MNILLIGNGFDLAHGLPTKYTDFLEFIRVIKEAFDIFRKKDKRTIRWGSLHLGIKRKIEENIGNTSNNLFSQEEMWDDLIKNNFWIEYFIGNPIYQKEDWIDFESEIHKVIEQLDFSMCENNRYDIINRCNDFLRRKYPKFGERNRDTGYYNVEITLKDIRDELLDALNKFIRAFEIYLAEYVEKIDIKVISPDIREIVNLGKDNNERNIKTGETIYNKIISFNYTNTYEQIYLKDCAVDLSEVIDYIHGKANIDNTMGSNNMVLGIDEYLSDDRKNEDIEFIAFKKYFQRIHKGTGCKYKEWLDEIKERFSSSENDEWDLKWVLAKQEYHLYIFGHSLDITDKDILRELILTRGMFTTIYYRNLEQKGQQIANLVKVIGQDELIKRTGGGSARTIEFKRQQDMEDIK